MLQRSRNEVKNVINDTLAQVRTNGELIYSKFLDLHTKKTDLFEFLDKYSNGLHAAKKEIINYITEQFNYLENANRNDMDILKDDFIDCTNEVGELSGNLHKDCIGKLKSDEKRLLVELEKSVENIRNYVRGSMACIQQVSQEQNKKHQSSLNEMKEIVTVISNEQNIYNDKLQSRISKVPELFKQLDEVIGESFAKIVKDKTEALQDISNRVNEAKDATSSFVRNLNIAKPIGNTPIRRTNVTKFNMPQKVSKDILNNHDESFCSIGEETDLEIQEESGIIEISSDSVECIDETSE